VQLRRASDPEGTTPALEPLLELLEAADVVQAGEMVARDGAGEGNQECGPDAVARGERGLRGEEEASLSFARPRGQELSQDVGARER
jgi:hypothetical protein